MYHITQKYSLLGVALLLIGVGLLAGGTYRAYADPAQTTITCYDKKGKKHSVTVNRSGTAFTTKDFQNACKAKGYTYKVPTAPKSSGSSSDPNVNGCASINTCDLITKYVNPFIRFLSALVGVAVVISIVIGGIQYAGSSGDSAQVSAAKNRIRNAIIALITYLFLFALLNFLIPGGLL